MLMIAFHTPPAVQVITCKLTTHVQLSFIKKKAKNHNHEIFSKISYFLLQLSLTKKTASFWLLKVGREVWERDDIITRNKF